MLVETMMVNDDDVDVNALAAELSHHCRLVEESSPTYNVTTLCTLGLGRLEYQL